MKEEHAFKFSLKQKKIGAKMAKLVFLVCHLMSGVLKLLYMSTHWISTGRRRKTNPQFAMNLYIKQN